MRLTRQGTQPTHVQQRRVRRHCLSKLVFQRLPLVVVGQPLAVAPVVVRLRRANRQKLQQRRPRLDPLIDRINPEHLAGGRKLKQLLFGKYIKSRCRWIALRPGLAQRRFVACIGIDGGAQRLKGSRVYRRSRVTKSTLGQRAS
jgi:hypothetical protein